MIRKILGVTGELVLSNKQLGYEEVLASFDQAESVTVVTFNVSLKRDVLIEKLRGLNVPVRLITNIPSRWEVNEDGTRETTEAVTEYMDTLNPDNFGPLASVSFCFSNHSKVIMTDQIGYIGSANYADESAGNWEFGIIIRDPNVLDNVSTAIDEIDRNSVRYFGPAVRDSIVSLLVSAANLRKLSERLGRDFEEVDEHELTDAIEELRDAIANSDPGWSEGFDASGPFYDKIDELLLKRIEEWFDSKMSVWELKQADERLTAAENGDIELPFDNDGNPIDAAQHDMIEERIVEREGCALEVQKEIYGLQRLIDKVITQVASVCNEISECVTKIKDIPPEPQLSSVKCPRCGKQMLKRKGQRGMFLGCSDFPNCKGTIGLDSEGKPQQIPQISEHECGKCGLPMVIREGPYGKFLGCSAYPKCKSTMPMPDIQA